MLQHKDSNYYTIMKAKDIINQLLEYKSIKAGSFAKEIGVHPTQIYDLQSEKTKKISASIASKIVNRYPEYPMIMYAITERLSCHLEKERNHPLTTRRYYRQMEY